MIVRVRSFRGALAAWWRDQCGAAAAEFALVLTLLSIPILNVVDLGIYVYQRMELDNAAQIGAQAAWAMVPNCTMPLTTGSCSGTYASAISTAVQSTSLASAATASTTENYYCVNAAGNLVVVGTLRSKPADCSAVGVPTGTPGDYVIVTASYTYTPVFTAVSVLNYLTTTITRNVYMRLS
jgi:Flp pilus assembly protein TadG